MRQPTGWIIISSGNGLSPTWGQAIPNTNADFVLIGHFGTNAIATGNKMQSFVGSTWNWKCRLQDATHLL